MINGAFETEPATPSWMPKVLIAAAVYNLAWGLWIVACPLVLFRLCGMATPNYPQVWQCVGMIVGVYGIGYAIAATDPLRHWPIVLVGFLGKVFGPIGFVQSAMAGALPWSFGVINIFNDLIWWVPFGLILWHAFHRHRAAVAATPSISGAGISGK